MSSSLSYIYWNVRPEAFHLGPLTVRWYGILFALAFVFGYFIVSWEFRREKKDPKELDSLLIYMMVGTVVGARLGHVIFYQPGYFLHHPVEILEIWKGGLASHGGAAGILIALYFYSRRRPDQPYLWVLDKVALPTALGGCLIRMGNLFNSEILGHPAKVPWAFIFARVDMVPRHPAQLYESIGYLLIFFFLLLVYRRQGAKMPRGLMLGLFCVTVFTLRFLVEFVKQRQADYGHNFPLTVGQWLSIPFILFGAVLVVRGLFVDHPLRSRE